MRHDLTEDQFLLAYTLQTVASANWEDRWEQYREHILWHMLVSGHRQWGRTRIDDDSIVALRLLAECVGGWIYFDAERGAAYLPQAEWERKHAQALLDYPDILRFF